MSTGWKSNIRCTNRARQRRKKFSFSTHLSVIFLSVSSKVHDHICCISNNGGKNKHATKICKDAEQQAHCCLRRHLFACTHCRHGYQRTKQTVKVLWTHLSK